MWDSGVRGERWVQEAVCEESSKENDCKKFAWTESGSSRTTHHNVTYKVWSVSPHGLVLWCISVVSESHDMTLFPPISSPIPEYFSGLTLSSQSSQGFYFLHIKREPLSQVFCLFVPSGA